MLRLESAGSERLNIRFDGRFFESLSGLSSGASESLERAAVDCGPQMGKEYLAAVWACAEARIASSPSRAKLIVKWSAILKGLLRCRCSSRAFIFLPRMPVLIARATQANI